jgi:predicted ATPase
VTTVRGSRQPRTGFFLRAESFFNVATHIEALDAEPDGGRRIIDSYGGLSLHEQSHGESFLSLILNRFGPSGLYILDEPEAALSLRAISR